MDLVKNQHFIDGLGGNTTQLPMRLDLRQMTPEEIGLEMGTVLRFLQLYGDDKVMEGVRKLYGDERVLKESARRLGEERVMKELMQVIGEERTVKGLAQTIGEERLRQIIEQLFSKKSDNNDG